MLVLKIKFIKQFIWFENNWLNKEEKRYPTTNQINLDYVNLFEIWLLKLSFILKYFEFISFSRLQKEIYLWILLKVFLIFTQKNTQKRELVFLTSIQVQRNYKFIKIWIPSLLNLQTTNQNNYFFPFNNILWL